MVVFPTIHSSTTQEDKSKILPKTGRQKLLIHMHTACSRPHKHAHSTPKDGGLDHLFLAVLSAGHWHVSLPLSGPSLLPGISRGPSSAQSLPMPPKAGGPAPGNTLVSVPWAAMVKNQGLVPSKDPKAPPQSDRTGVLGRTQRWLQGEKKHVPSTLLSSWLRPL